MDVTLADLWLPILLAAVFVFLASSVIHMALPIHKKDVGKLAGEDAILETMRAQNVELGDYMFPCPGSMQEMGTPEFQERMKRGPVGYMTIVSSYSIGKSLVQWFVLSILVSILVAYVLTFACARGSDYMVVMRLAGTVGFMAYSIGCIPNSIWKGTRWSTTFKFVIDGLIYGLVTGGTFGWLWPGIGG